MNHLVLPNFTYFTCSDGDRGGATNGLPSKLDLPVQKHWRSRCQRNRITEVTEWERGMSAVPRARTGPIPAAQVKTLALENERSWRAFRRRALTSFEITHEHQADSWITNSIVIQRTLRMMIHIARCDSKCVQKVFRIRRQCSINSTAAGKSVNTALAPILARYSA
jgi:hypothetical protein